MTHTLNRRGLSEERPGEEIILLCNAHIHEKDKKSETIKKMAQLILKYKPDNIIGRPLGFNEEGILGLSARAGVITAIFHDVSTVINLLKEIKAEKFGISVVVSGLFSDVRKICEAVDMKEHTYNIPLGIYGKTEKLFDEKNLEITTQCGHGLISGHLVKDVVKKIKKGKMKSTEAVGLLIKPCVCGIANPSRIKGILESMAKEES